MRHAVRSLRIRWVWVVVVSKTIIFQTSTFAFNTIFVNWNQKLWAYINNHLMKPLSPSSKLRHSCISSHRTEIIINKWTFIERLVSNYLWLPEDLCQHQIATYNKANHWKLEIEWQPNANALPFPFGFGYPHVFLEGFVGLSPASSVCSLFSHFHPHNPTCHLWPDWI